MVMRSTGTPLSEHLLRLEERERPRATGPFDVVVEVAAAGVCRTDLHLMTGEMPAPCPLILGHENAGVVHEVGALVRSVSVGDTVLCYPFLSSGLSAAERDGLDTGAPDRVTPGITADGGYAEYLLTHERSMVKVPAQTDLAAVATLTDAGLAAYRGAKRAASTLRANDHVVVFGIGGLGHLGVQILRALSPAQVIAVDTNPAALELARECGAHETLTPDEAAASHHARARAVVDYVGSDATARLGLDLLGFGGSYYAVGVGGTLQLPIARLVEGEYSIEGVFVGTYSDLLEVSALCLAGRVRPRYTVYPLEDANQALLDLEAGRIIGRAVLVPNVGR
jgi:NAD+-dependent secondary alcohol dehydrogenase Adh1